MKKLPFIILSLLVGACALIHSCSTSDCPLTTVSVAHFDFLDSETHSTYTFSTAFDVTGFILADVTVYDTLSDGTIQERIVRDSVLNDTIYNDASTTMSLPMGYTELTTYVLHYTERMRDTIRVAHKSTPYLEDIECGTMMFYTVENVTYTTNRLDSITIINPNINNEEKQNFIIYYRSDSTD